MRRFTLHWGWALTLSIILAIVVGIQFLIHEDILAQTAKWETTCTFVEWDTRSDNRVKMKVQCEDGEEGTVFKNTVIVGFLRDPGPLACQRFETGRVSCEARGQVEEDI